MAEGVLVHGALEPDLHSPLPHHASCGLTNVGCSIVLYEAHNVVYVG